MNRLWGAIMNCLGMHKIKHQDFIQLSCCRYRALIARWGQGTDVRGWPGSHPTSMCREVPPCSLLPKTFQSIPQECKVNTLRLWSCVCTCCDPTSTFLGPCTRQCWEKSCTQSACLSHVYRAWSSPAINTHGCQRDKIITLLVGFQEKCGPKLPCSTHQRNFIEFKITILPSETDLALNHNSSVVGTLQFKSFLQQGNKSFKKYIKSVLIIPSRSAAFRAVNLFFF